MGTTGVGTEVETGRQAEASVALQLTQCRWALSTFLWILYTTFTENQEFPVTSVLRVRGAGLGGGAVS